MCRRRDIRRNGSVCEEWVVDDFMERWAELWIRSQDLRDKVLCIGRHSAFRRETIVVVPDPSVIVGK